MISIKFSHTYPKIPREAYVNPIGATKLFAVIPFDDECISQQFRDYDTLYGGYEPDHMEGKYYPLPKGKKILLLLSSFTTHNPCLLWTTLRRWTPEKEKYYLSHLGELVGIEIIEESK